MGKTELDNLVNYLEKNRVLIPCTGSDIFSCKELLEEINLLRILKKSEDILKKTHPEEVQDQTLLIKIINYLEENVLGSDTDPSTFSFEKMLKEIGFFKDPDKKEKVVKKMSFEEACKQSLLGKGCLYNKYGDVIYGNHITGKIQCKPAKNSDIVFLSSMWSFDKDIISEGEESRGDF